MAIKIVIPSHKRHDRVLSKNLVHDSIICVEQSQYDLYKEYNPDNEIVCHPDNVVGLIPKRNWMIKHFGDLFMIDDDVYMFHSLFKGFDDNNYSIKDKSFITRKIFELYELAVLTDIPLFGFTKNPRPEQYKDFKPFSLSHSITGCAYGVLNNKNLYWDEAFKLKEDFLISCYCKYLHRKILIDNRYNFSQKDTFVNPGGLSEIRNHDSELESMMLLRKYFGESVEIKKDNIKNCKQKKFNITVKFKY